MNRAYKNYEIISKYVMIKHEDNKELPYISYKSIINTFEELYKIPTKIIQMVKIHFFVYSTNLYDYNVYLGLHNFLSSYNEDYIKYQPEDCFGNRYFDINSNDQMQECCFYYNISIDLFNPKNKTKNAYKNIKMYHIIINTIRNAVKMTNSVSLQKPILFT